MISRIQAHMGTFVTITLPQEHKALFPSAFDVVKQVDNSLSSYKPNSIISKLNHNKEVKVDFYAYDALSLAQRYYTITNGYFNVAVGSVTKKAFRFGEEERLPTAAQLKDANVSLQGLYVDEHRATIAQETVIDLGGMGKGYGVDRVVHFLRHKGLKRGVVAFSGDIRCLDRCSVAVNNPFSTLPLATFVTKHEDTAISTSGIYNRYVEDMDHNHLINPKTKRSQNRYLSVTLISNLPNSDIDAFATAFSVMPPQEGLVLLQRVGVAYIIWQKDGKVVLSDNLFEYVDALTIDKRLLDKKE